MNRLTVSNVVLIILHSVFSAHANVKITPIAVENNKSNLKSADLKVEEARYQNPIMPEYYGNSYDRNRQNFVTSSYGSYGSGLSNYDRYGYNGGSDGLSNYDRYGYNGGSDRYGSNYDRVGSQWNSNKDRTGLNFGSNPLNPIGNKFNYMPGGTYNPSSGFGNNYGNRNPYEGGQVNGPYPGSGIAGAFGGMGNGMGFPPDLEGKSSLILPLAGAALLGIAAYALVANPGIAMGPMMGKRRKRSLFDEKLEQHLMYRAHQSKQKAAAAM